MVKLSDLSQVAKRTTLPNGLTIIVVDYPNINSVGLHTWVFSGSAYESRENNGISHFLEHMIFRGNTQLGNAYKMSLCFEKLGGEMNASTSVDQTEYWLHFHRDFLEEGVRRYCQFLQFPLFQQIEVEREIILEEIKSDYNEDNLLVNSSSLSALALWPHHSLGFPVSGIQSSIKNITLEDLKAWHSRFYYPSNMIIGITGSLDSEKVFQYVEEEFSSKEKGKKQAYDAPPIQPEKGKQLVLVEDKDNQYELQWSFPLNRLSPELRMQLRLMRRILDDGFSSRLQRLIREEKGLVYDISGDLEFMETEVIFSITAVVSDNKLLELSPALTTLIRDLYSKGVSQEELDLARLRLKAALDYHRDSAEGILFECVEPLENPEVLPREETLALVEKCNLEEINQLVIELFKQENTIVVLVGPDIEKVRPKIEELFEDWTIPD